MVAFFLFKAYTFCMIPKPLEMLMKDLGSLPGFGKRSAQKAALHLLTHPEVMSKVQLSMTEVSKQVKTCVACGNISLSDPCHVCNDISRDASLICVVEGVDDLWAMERSGAFKGMYHVLGGVVSAIDGVSMDDLKFEDLFARIEKQDVKEVILALGSSVDGQTTSHLIARRLKGMNVDVSTLARGIPMGAEVDYMDEGTLSLALKGRLSF